MSFQKGNWPVANYMSAISYGGIQYAVFRMGGIQQAYGRNTVGMVIQWTMSWDGTVDIISHGASSVRVHIYSIVKCLNMNSRLRI